MSILSNPKIVFNRQSGRASPHFLLVDIFFNNDTVQCTLQCDAAECNDLKKFRICVLCAVAVVTTDMARG